MNITIISDNAKTLNVTHDLASISDILSLDSVLSFFDVDEASDICESVEEINGAVVSSALISLLLGSDIEDGMTIKIGLSAVGNDAPASAGAPVSGFVTVATSGGLQTTIVKITSGVTTVKEAIYNDLVKGRCGMTDAQLSTCEVMLDGAPIAGECLEAVTVTDGQTICLSPRTANTKGL